MEVTGAELSEAVALDLYASWGRRLAAWLMDGVVIGVAAAASTLFGDGGADGALVLVLLPPAYFTACHGGLFGQTLGKRVVGISVRDVSSLGRIGYVRAFARWLVTTVLWFLLVVPGVLDNLRPLWNERHQSWHDAIVGSVVIRL